MTFKPVRHLSWTAKVFCIAIGYISSKDFLDEHHIFDEIEAVHRFGNHGNILALGWRNQAIALIDHGKREGDATTTIVNGRGESNSMKAAATTNLGEVKYVDRLGSRRCRPPTATGNARLEMLSPSVQPKKPDSAG